jgi:hypothetical protein
MMPTTTHVAAERGRILTWFVIPLLPLLISTSGCSDNGDGRATAPTATPSTTRTLSPSPSRTPTRTPTLTPTTAVSPNRLACQRLESCDPCFFINQRGECLSASTCELRLATDDASCINAVSACDQVVTCFDRGCAGDRTCTESN